jgi:hypothetical protein
MPSQIIPLTNKPNQSFNVSLNIDGATLTLQLSITFNSMAGYWIMQVSDQFGNMIIDSVPMVTGTYPGANLWEQYAYLKIGSAFLINISQSPTDSPNQSNLGTDFLLLWSDTPLS